MSAPPWEEVSARFEDFMGGRFRLQSGPARARKERACQKKLCFYAADQRLLARTLDEICQREDAFAVKYSTYEKGGIYLGRAFLVDEQAVGELWKALKPHPELFCAVQDDDWASAFR